ncbi:hypothetical protein ACJ72_06376 [Emergomyces africanus]|uniref:DUF1746 domain-containing protein n=1 Tax=Emergomyces africanus TaxID=1955775 RepID=A0A1B7NRF2_9EURO|nr:hypothetical protein ACJ72_06373 [Emergomyces africanus]OAX79309.1 hypothetical protein ACJ72_06376 [Emergomyces africanus]
MTTPDVFRDAQYIADVSNIPYDPNDDDGASDRPGVSGRSYRRAVYATSKTVMLVRLLRDLDMLIYCELSALYYMDCSILHFAIRAVIQFIFFTPKATQLPETSTTEPSIVAVFASNIFCIFLHYMSASPMAGEATRGYLHGGLFIDFIGQKGPISKFHLFLLDLLILAMQVIMLCVILEKDRTKLLGRPADSTNRVPNLEDHDSEERGVPPGDENLPGMRDETTAGNIEMQGLAAERSSDESSARLLEFEAERGAPAPARDRHPRDPFVSAQATIADINIFQNLRDQWYSVPRTNVIPSTGSQPPTSTQNGMVVPFLRRGFRFQFRTISS